jgi:hypothetical protein
MPTTTYSLTELAIMLAMNKANVHYLLKHNIIINKKVPNLSGKQNKYQITSEELTRVRKTLKANQSTNA